ncbi:MAG: PAS domain-containing sensor histidine kinase [Planctomycetes bacterium]|nr:PAS domain-containing sensor histidine kinase [Planctomycetota bacterium]
MPFFTPDGSFWTADTEQPFVFTPRHGTRERRYVLGGPSGFRSLALFPLAGGRGVIGLLVWKSRTAHRVSAKEIGLYETVAQNLGLALALFQTRAELAVRLKELTCLFGVSRLANHPAQSRGEILQKIVDLIPPAMLHADAAHARLVVDEEAYESPGFANGVQRLASAIVVSGTPRGCVEVVYTSEKPELDEGPFLSEEKHLLDTVAREVSSALEEKAAEEERANLERQLRHADRLATIGQLASGVAHELNEPLGGVLGYAQLIQKCEGLSEQVAADVQKIVNASLHAREVIRKLMLFARQHPTRKTDVNLNATIRDGLDFLESRCETAGIELRRELAEDLPLIAADPPQMQQVLVNLVVNAIQAMPDGGALTVRTARSGAEVVLTVEDTGVGIPKEILSDIFLPFFTTKDVREGTGLGLAVVHGIVTSHGGRIVVRSEVGKGSQFETRFPAAQGAREEAGADGHCSEREEADTHCR